ncbi:DNA-directed RNA polymerase [Gongronella butleri]|nr:DNA-directed RNA polymerase [Gongronella butleri]
MSSDAGSDREDQNDVIMEEEEEEDHLQGSDVEMEEEEDQVLVDKVEIIGGGDDQTAMTFSLKDEDHTFGNSLRFMVNKNPQVDFCGYSIPHPSVAKMNLRIQTSTKTTAVDAFRKGMTDLTELTQHIRQAYIAELEKGNFETFEEII